MRAGSLRHRITFQLKTETNTGGSVTESWTDSIEDVPAEFEPIRGAEYPVASSMGNPPAHKRTSEATARFRIRYLQALMAPDAQGRPAHDRYRIKFVLDRDASPPLVQYFNMYPPQYVDGRRRELLIEATEVL